MISVSLGDRDDAFQNLAPAAASGDMFIDGGDGNDSLGGGSGVDAIDGGAGDDVLVGFDGGDVLGGGDGNDTLRGGRGDDTLDGGAGIDTVDFRDTLEGPPPASPGGPLLTGRVSVTIDGVRNDTYAVPSTGQIAGTDNVLTTVEHVIGTDLADTIVGSGAANVLDGRGGDDTLRGGPSTLVLRISLPTLALPPSQISTTRTAPVSPGGDTLLGGAGADTLTGTLGNDFLEGQAGRDAYAAGAGADSLFTRDGEADRIDCGSGTSFDGATIDLRDTDVTGCENVDRGERREGSAVALPLKLRAARNATVPVPITCPRGQRTRCAGRLSLSLGSRRAGTSRRYSLRPGRGATVSIALTESARRALRGGRRPVTATLTSLEQGSFGLKTTIRRVTVATVAAG